MAKTTTIHALNFQVLADTTQFTKGMGLSKKELALMKREMRLLASPADKMEARLKKLGELAKKDATAQKVYTAALAKHTAEVKKSKLDKQIKEQERLNRIREKSIALTKKQSKVGGGGGLGALAIGGIGVAIGAKVLGSAVRWGKAAANAFIGVMDTVDAANKISQTIGVSTEFQSKLKFVAGRVSGLTDGQVDKAMIKMTRRISEAAVGMGEAQNAIKEIGLEAKVLAAAGPEKAFLMIARAMDGVTSQHDRLRIATKLFDDEQAAIHTTLQLSSKEFENLTGLAERYGVVLSQINADKLSESKDALSDLGAAWDGLKIETAAGAAPAVTEFLQLASSAFNTARSGEFKNNESFAGQFKDQTLDRIVSQRTDFGRLKIETELANIMRDLRGKSEEKTARATRSKENLSSIFSGIGSFGKESVDFAGAAFPAILRRTLFAGKNQLREAPSLFGRSDRDQFTAERGTVGPGQSIAAGSSEAFRAINRIATIKQVKVSKEEKERTKDASRSANALENLETIFGAITSIEFLNLEGPG